MFRIIEFILRKKYIFIGGFLSLIIIALIFLFLFNNKNTNVDVVTLEKIEDNIIVENDEDVIEENSPLCLASVDIKGLVKNPGLYQLECGKRVKDVIDIAGGLKNNADTSVINLGKKISDEMVIVIYSKDEVNNFTETKEKQEIKEEKCINEPIIINEACVCKEDLVENNVVLDKPVEAISDKVNINTASKEELMTLSGIGESKAIDIIKYREENGLFKAINEIMNISGIGEKLFDKIKNNITL